MLATLLTACGGGGGSSAGLPPVASGGAAPPPPAAAPPPAPAGGARTTLQNGVEWPASLVAYGTRSPFNVTLPANPKLLSDSATRIADAYKADGDSSDFHLRWMPWGNGWDGNHPTYVATNGDPLVHATCNGYCSDVGKSIDLHIPAKARPESGSDHHIDLIEPNGDEYSFWLFSSPNGDWQNGQSAQYNSGTNCGGGTNNFYQGMGMGSGAVAGNACLAAGIIHVDEWQAGNIGHALFTGGGCVDPHEVVWPALGSALPCPASLGPVVPTGALLTIKISDSAIDALPINAWEKTLLHAIKDHGMYYMDTGGGHGAPGGVTVESNAPVDLFGGHSAVPTFLGSLPGWTHDSLAPASGAPIQSGLTEYRYNGGSDWNPFSSIGQNWASEMEIVDPCVPQGTC